MKKINLLSKAEMKKILGGTVDEDAPVSGASCTANCPSGTVTCYVRHNGSCTAVDNVGCKTFNQYGYPLGHSNCTYGNPE